MKVALGSDEKTTLTDAVAADLRRRGHEVVPVGPPAGEAAQWPEVSKRVGELVADRDADTAVLFCWTGTGASIAANKVPGIRAALCTDPATAAGARKYNDANVLVMSLRLTSETVASEMLDEWFATAPDPSEAANIASLE
jgi:ribose 5-phosphate isomerase B